MRRRTRLVGLLVLALMSGALALAALAWACTPQAYVSMSPSSGPPGTVVTITGEKFVAGGRVEIRTGAVDGAPLATATGPTFSVTVTIPQGAAAGYQTLGATGYGTDGQAEGTATRSFQVTDPGAAKTAPTRAPTAPPRHTASPSPTSSRHHASPQLHVTPQQPAAPRQHPARVENRPSVAPRAQAAPAVGAPVLTAATSSSPSGPAVSVAPAVAPVVAPRPLAAGSHVVVRHAALDRTSTGPARRAAQPAWPSAGRSLSTDTAPSATGAGRLAIGIGLLGVGLVALFAGFAVAEVRRRRAPVGPRR